MTDASAATAVAHRTMRGSLRGAADFQGKHARATVPSMFGILRRLRHRRIREQPFPEAWAAILDRDVPYVKLLDEDERAWLEDLVQVFLAEKTFEGAKGLEVTDRMRVVVAAQACLLLLGDEETAVFPELFRIVMYPEAFLVPTERADGVVIREAKEARIGESWDRGVVVLSWSHSAHGARNREDAKNVVMHEFAHQLDQELGDADGAPELPRGMAYGHWARVLGKEFENLERKTAAGRVSLLDAYGATNPAEFFAVATEHFFEKPQKLLAKKPELYRQLAAYYRQDPAARFARPKT